MPPDPPWEKGHTRLFHKTSCLLRYLLNWIARPARALFTFVHCFAVVCKTIAKFEDLLRTSALEDELSFSPVNFLPRKLRTVPTIVIAHTFCASRDNWISYRRCLLIREYIRAVQNYSDKAELSKSALGIQKKIGGTHAFFRNN